MKRIIIILLIVVSHYCVAQNNSPCPPRGGDQNPTPKNGTETINPNAVAQTEGKATQAQDPNEIVGTDGWLEVNRWGDTTRWVSATQVLPYTIYFENDPELATAAAQVVKVRMKFDPRMNMADFGVGTFGFANRLFTVSGNPLQYQTRLDLREEMDLYVDVVAGIDITTNEAFWIFSSIDPATGVAPSESDRGFLAVNDSSHIGEGFVSFTVKPRVASCHSGDTISVFASIVFDDNDAIETNRWVNTIDAESPTSNITVVQQAHDSVRVAFSGSDNATGIAAYRMYYTENSSAFRLAGRYGVGDTAVMPMRPNTRYSFFSLGEDKVGNIEPMKNNADTLFGNSHVQLLANVSPAGAATIAGVGTYDYGDTAHFVLHPAEGYGLKRWVEAGVPRGSDTMMNVIADGNHSFTAELERIRYPLTVAAAEGTTITTTIRSNTGTKPAFQEIQHFDTLEIHLAASPCYRGISYSLDGSPLTEDTMLVVTAPISLSSTAMAYTDTGNVYDQICAGFDYSANGFSIPSTDLQTSGTIIFQQSTFTINGCDSIAVLHLTVNHPIHTDTVAIACENFIWHEENHFVSGNYNYSHLDANNCTQVDTLHLTVNHPINGDTTAVACENFSWHGESHSVSGSYTYSHADINGCTQVDTLHLIVNYPENADTTAMACENYTWHGESFSASGSYIYTHQDANGCTQVDTMHLTVNNPVHIDTTAVACENFTWHGESHSVSGNYTYQHADINGCTQVDTLHLTINTPVLMEVYDTACDSYTWYGVTFTVTGDYHRTWTDTLPGVCDSTEILHLTVNYSNEATVTDTAEESYIWHDTIYTQSGTYTWIGQTAEGCDSTVSLVLIVNHVGIDKLEGDMTVTVYPNPTSGMLTIDATDVLLVEVFDQGGLKVASLEKTNRIDLGILPAGVYLLRITLVRGLAVYRVVLR